MSMSGAHVLAAPQAPPESAHACVFVQRVDPLSIEISKSTMLQSTHSVSENVFVSSLQVLEEQAVAEKLPFVWSQMHFGVLSVHVPSGQQQDPYVPQSKLGQSDGLETVLPPNSAHSQSVVVRVTDERQQVTVAPVQAQGFEAQEVPEPLKSTFTNTSHSACVRPSIHPK